MALWNSTDHDDSRPKYLNAADLSKCIFVDTTEALQKANKDRGLTGAGWWLYTTYTDAQGNTRYKTENLVAMAATAVAAGDRVDDATAADAQYVLTIGTHPANTDTSDGTLTFTVASTVTSGGGTITYQWQRKLVGSTNWTDMVGEESDSLALTGRLAVNTGDQYRVHINSANGAAQVRSDSGTLTFVLYVIGISVQPTAQNTDTGAATFSVTAATTPVGGTLTYQWQKALAATPTVFSDVVGETTDSLALTGQGAGAHGDKYRVVVSTYGPATATSAAGTLTFVD